MKPRFALCGKLALGALPFAAALILCSCQGVQSGTTAAMAESTPASKAAVSDRLSPEAYDKAMMDISKEMDSANKALDESVKTFQSTGGKDPKNALKEFSKVFVTYGDSMTSVSKKVAALNPPAELEKVNKVLADGTGQLAALSNQCAEAMSKSDQQALAKAMQDLNKFQTEFPENLNTAVKEAGYKFDAEGNLVKA